MITVTALLCLLTLSAASAALVTVDETMSSLNVSASLDYLEDRNSTLTFEEVRQSAGTLPWTANDRNYVNFGYTSSAYWFRLVLQDSRRKPDRLLLEIDFPGLDHVNFYYPDGHGGYASIRTGDYLPFESRGIRDRNYIFPIDPAGRDRTYFINIHNNSSFRFRAYLHTENSLLANREWSIPLIWFIYGMVLLTGFFYFFLFAFMRDRAYLYFFITVLAIFLHQAVLRGFAFQYFWPAWTRWNNSVMPFITCCCGIFTMLFIREILDIRSTNIFFHRISGAFIYFLFPALALLSLVVRVKVIIPMMYYAIIAFGVLVVIIAVYYTGHGNRFARYLLAGIISIVIASVITIAAAFRGLPAVPATEWSIEFGFLVLVLFSSLGLVDRFWKMAGALEVSRGCLQDKNVILTRTNEELRISLDEKIALIREVHHRAKNNMQIVCGLLDQQVRNMDRPETVRSITDAVVRIQSMAGIHERIYQTGNFSMVDMSGYIEELTRYLVEQYADTEKKWEPIKIVSRLSPVFVPVDMAIPCGLLIGEILSNAIKHGCPGSSESGIDLFMECIDGRAMLVIADHGPGMRRELFYDAQKKTLGMQIIDALSRQIGAGIDVDVERGTRFTVRFPGCTMQEGVS